LSKFIYERLWIRDFIHHFNYPCWEDQFPYHERFDADFNNIYKFFGEPEVGMNMLLNKKMSEWLIKVNDHLMLLTTFDQPLWLATDWFLKHGCIEDADILLENLNNDKERRIRHDPTEASSKHIENSS